MARISLVSAKSNGLLAGSTRVGETARGDRDTSPSLSRA
jgi:hypothetical protein